MSKKILLYPGSFDPPTLGHYDIVSRGLNFCDELVIGINQSSETKRYIFDFNQRKKMFESYLSPEESKKIRVTTYSDLTIDLAREVGAFAILRGLRTYSDFEFEFQMAAMNKSLDPELETVFIRTDDRLAHISSSLVKEVARFSRHKNMVSPFVAKELSKRLQSKS